MVSDTASKKEQRLTALSTASTPTHCPLSQRTRPRYRTDALNRIGLSLETVTMQGIPERSVVPGRPGEVGRGGGRDAKVELAFGEGRAAAPFAPLSLVDVVKGFFFATGGFTAGVWGLARAPALDDVDLTEVMEGGRARAGGAMDGIGGARMAESDLIEAEDLGRRRGSVDVVDATEVGLRDAKVATTGVTVAFSFPLTLAVVDGPEREVEGTLVDARSVVGMGGRDGARDCVGVRAPLGFADDVVGFRWEVMEGAGDAGGFEVEEVAGRVLTTGVPLALGRRAAALLDSGRGVLTGGVGAVVERVGKAFMGGRGGV